MFPECCFLFPHASPSRTMLGTRRSKSVPGCVSHAGEVVAEVFLEEGGCCWTVRGGEDL